MTGRVKCGQCGEYWPCSDSQHTDIRGDLRAQHGIAQDVPARPKNPLELLTDTDLATMTDRAYRESVRCWREFGAADRDGSGAGAILIRTLRDSAQSADAFWNELKSEARRRAEEV